MLIDLLTARSAFALADSECADWLARPRRGDGGEQFVCDCEARCLGGAVERVAVHSHSDTETEARHHVR